MIMIITHFIGNAFVSGISGLSGVISGLSGRWRTLATVFDLPLALNWHGPDSAGGIGI